MNKFVNPAFVVTLLHSCSTFIYAQQNVLPVKMIRLDSITAIGKPDGEAETNEISTEGGTIVSADGKLELLFPQGALSKKKKITIQPVINHAANGRGKAYRMEPSGLQFDKPVTIVFHYSQEETSGTLPGLKGIAGQNEKGKWEVLPDVAVDTTAKTISSQIHHFSSYTAFDKIVLAPQQGRVKVEKTQGLWLSIADYTPLQGSDGELPPLPPRVNIPDPDWAVNGIRRGDQHNGWITGDGTSVVYNAPASVPTDNPVAVSIQLKGLQFTFNKKVFKDPMLVSHLLIYDKAYRITMNIWVDNSEDGMCTMRVEDQGAFTLVMEGTRTMIKEIVNHNQQIRFNPCKCAPVWTNRPLVKGPINIAGASRIDVTPASLPANPFPRIRITLQHISSPLPSLRSPCPAGGLPPASIHGNMLRYFLPPFIEFVANNEDEQVITLANLSGGAETNNRRQGLKIAIKRIDEE
jgi:hypothetical protein